jgi:hypothetical protein
LFHVPKGLQVIATGTKVNESTEPVSEIRTAG